MYTRGRDEERSAGVVCRPVEGAYLPKCPNRRGAKSAKSPEDPLPALLALSYARNLAVHQACGSSEAHVGGCSALTWGAVEDKAKDRMREAASAVTGARAKKAERRAQRAAKCEKLPAYWRKLLINAPEHFYCEVGAGIIRSNLDNRTCKPISILSCYGEPCDVQPVQPVRYLDVLYLITV